MKKITALSLTLLLAFFISVPSASAHQSGCHRWHSCPSDDGSYVCGDLGQDDECPDKAGTSGKDDSKVSKKADAKLAKICAKHTKKHAKELAKLNKAMQKKQLPEMKLAKLKAKEKALEKKRTEACGA